MSIYNEAVLWFELGLVWRGFVYSGAGLVSSWVGLDLVE